MVFVDTFYCSILIFIVGILELAHSRRIGARKATGPLQDLADNISSWRTLKDAGWTPHEVQHVIKMTREEGDTSAFQGDLLRASTFTGVSKGTSFNSRLYAFKHGAENITQYLSKPTCAIPTAMFVLGPSSVGKTTMLASLFGLECKMACPSEAEKCIKKCYDQTFPVLADDGAIWRDVSAVWNTFARGKFLSDYYDTIFKPGAKDLHAKLVNDWIVKYRPCTIAIPEVASSISKVQQSVAHFESLGYKVRFVAIHAPYKKAFQSGEARAIREGKAYNPNGFVLAVVSVFSLHKIYVKKQVRPYTWQFLDNTFEKEALPNVISWTEYKRKAKLEVQDISQEAPTWTGRMLAKTCAYRINAWSVKKDASQEESVGLLG